METVPFFTPRGKLILNKGAMPSISGLKCLSVCVNVVSKNAKLIWQNLNSAETKTKIRQRQVSGKGGAMVRVLSSHRCRPGSNPGVDAIYGLSLLLVLPFAPRGFSPGTPVSPSPQKPTLPNSNSIWNARTRLNEFIWTLKCFVGKKAIFFINNKSRQKHVTPLYTYGHASVSTPCCILLRFFGSCCAQFETTPTMLGVVATVCTTNW